MAVHQLGTVGTSFCASQLMLQAALARALRSAVQEVPSLDEENFPSLGSTHGQKSPGDSQSPKSKSDTSSKADTSPKAAADGFAAAAAKPPAAEVRLAAAIWPVWPSQGAWRHSWLNAVPMRLLPD